MRKGVVVQIVNENIYQVFFNDGQEIAGISREYIHSFIEFLLVRSCISII